MSLKRQRFQYYFLGLLIIPPTKERHLPQLPVIGPFGISYFADQLWLNPLDLFLDLGRVLEWRLACQQWLHATERVIHACFAEARSGMAEVVQLPFAVSAQQKRI